VALGGRKISHHQANLLQLVACGEYIYVIVIHFVIYFLISTFGLYIHRGMI
jgi:hypothetical protein